MRRHDVAARDAGFDAHRRARKTRQRDPTGGRQEAGRRILGAEPRLERMAVAAHVGLRERQAAVGGDPQLQLDQVEPGDFLGDRVLDLEARVDLEEVMLRRSRR